MNAQIQAVINSIYNQGLSAGVGSLSGWKRDVYLLVELETYVSMEGLEGFFRSPLGGYRVDISAFLARIGATQSADLLRQANGMINGETSPDMALDSLSEAQLSQFDVVADAFSENPDGRSYLLEQYVAQQQ